MADIFSEAFSIFTDVKAGLTIANAQIDTAKTGELIEVDLPNDLDLSFIRLKGGHHVELAGIIVRKKS